MRGLSGAQCWHFQRDKGHLSWFAPLKILVGSTTTQKCFDENKTWMETPSSESGKVLLHPTAIISFFFFLTLSSLGAPQIGTLWSWHHVETKSLCCNYLLSVAFISNQSKLPSGEQKASVEFVIRRLIDLQWWKCVPSPMSCPHISLFTCWCDLWLLTFFFDCITYDLKKIHRKILLRKIRSRKIPL